MFINYSPVFSTMHHMQNSGTTFTDLAFSRGGMRDLEEAVEPALCGRVTRRLELLHPVTDAVLATVITNSKKKS